MSEPSRARVCVTHRFNFSAERVFDAWLDPTTLGLWLFATPAGQMVRVEVDARAGGRFVLVDRRDGVDVEHSGEYLEIDRPRRLVFSFGVPKYSAEFTRVTISILPLGGGCELTLLHEGVLPDYQQQTTSGWTMVLDSLARNLAATSP